MINLQYGRLLIQGDNASGNTASAQVSGGKVVATLNGQSQSFDQALVGSILYASGPSGADTFEANLSLPTVMYGVGGGNKFTGAPYLSYAYFSGAGNEYITQGGPNTVNDVFQHGGVPVTIYNPGFALVQIYND